jgi:hypothetical protein
MHGRAREPVEAGERADSSERLAVQRADEPCKLAVGGDGAWSADACIPAFAAHATASAMKTIALNGHV